MSTLVVPPSTSRVIYPDTDGKPMAENTLQFEWITKIKGGLDHLFADDPNVFVAGDLFWYPVEGHPEIVIAPDALVAFGRPKGHRMSYRQWDEGNIAPQVVFEILSPANRFGEMSGKFDFYQRYGVEEYYIYNPDPMHLELSGFLRRQNRLVAVEPMNRHMSPRLGLRFELGDDGLRLIRPDGRLVLTYEELARREEHERQRADAERQRADGERQRAEHALRELEQLRQRLGASGTDAG
jgi:Uma2 family endonuclease